MIMKKSFLKMTYLLVLFLFFNNLKIYSQDIEKDTLMDFYYPTIIELVCDSPKYDLKNISIYGVLNQGGYLFFSKEDFDYQIYKNSFKINIENIKQSALRDLNGKYVVINGVFRNRDKIELSGMITKVYSIVNIEDRLFELKWDIYIKKLRESDKDIFIEKK